MARRVNEELDTNTSTLEESNIHAEMDVDLDNSELEDEKIDKLDIPIPKHNEDETYNDEENEKAEEDMDEYIVGHRVKRGKKKIIKILIRK